MSFQKKNLTNMKRFRNHPSRRFGFTMLELVIAIFLLVLFVGLVGSHIHAMHKAAPVVSDSQLMNKTAEQLAYRFAAQKINREKTGFVIVDANNGLYIDPTNSPQGRRFSYVASLYIIPGGQIYLTVTLGGEGYRSVTASSQYTPSPPIA